MLPILLKTEEACVALATSASLAMGLTPETNVFIRRGVDNEDIHAPAIICQAASATEDFPFSGIYHVATHITVKQMAQEMTGSNLGQISEPLFHSFIDPNIELLLTNIVSNYFVYQVLITDTSDVSSGDAWSQEYQFDIVCGLQ